MIVYVRLYTCKSITKQHSIAATGVLAGSRRVRRFQDCNPHPHLLSRTKYVWYCGHRDHISCVPKTEELFQEHFYRLKAPGVEEEEDCGCHPMHRLLQI